MVGMSKEQIEEFMKSGTRESLAKLKDKETKKVIEDLMSSIGTAIQENNSWIETAYRSKG